MSWSDAIRSSRVVVATDCSATNALRHLATVVGCPDPLCSTLMDGTLQKGQVEQASLFPHWQVIFVPTGLTRERICSLEGFLGRGHVGLSFP